MTLYIWNYINFIYQKIFFNLEVENRTITINIYIFILSHLIIFNNNKIVHIFLFLFKLC